jgi:hypothetical protein
MLINSLSISWSRLDHEVRRVRGYGGVAALELICSAALRKGAEGHIISQVDHLTVQ